MTVASVIAAACPIYAQEACHSIRAQLTTENRQRVAFEFVVSHISGLHYVRTSRYKNSGVLHPDAQLLGVPTGAAQEAIVRQAMSLSRDDYAFQKQYGEAKIL
jgi:hypothetical protein